MVLFVTSSLCSSRQVNMHRTGFDRRDDAAGVLGAGVFEELLTNLLRSILGRRCGYVT